MVRKYTADIINSFDTVPRCDGDDFTNNGQKATHLLNIYGREFDEVKKYATGIKYAHVVTYNKRDNVPDSLTKDLVHMLGFEHVDLLSNFNLKNILMPSDGVEGFSGQSRDYTKKEVEIETYRRIILNIAWLWKSKGARKSIEFLFRLMGAPESTVVFDEHLYVADKPVDLNAIKRLLYFYTGDVDISGLPFDEDGYPLPPLNGTQFTVTSTTVAQNGETIVTTETDEMWYQKGGGWYRETGKDGAHVHTSVGNNPHAGPYDGGNEYIAQFESNCFIPGFKNITEYTKSATTLNENLFLNYNNGFFNGMPTDFDLYAVALEGNNNQLLNPCFDLEATVDVCPPLSAGTSVFQQLCIEALNEYKDWVGFIEEDPYLVYSPEWFTVKKNYEVANSQFVQELITENCDVNQCLAVCVKKKNIITPSCEAYNVRDDGIVLFEMGDGFNIVNPNIVQISRGDKSVCFEKIGVVNEEIEALLPNINEYLTPKDVEEYNTNNPQIAIANEVEGLDAAFAFSNLDGLDMLAEVESSNSLSATRLALLKALYNVEQFKPVPCYLAFTSIVSSPECCAWYNYSYTIVEENDKKVIACYDQFYEVRGGINQNDEIIVGLENQLEKKRREKEELEAQINKAGGAEAVRHAAQAARKKY
jgi:hypothetical protein